MFLMVIKLSLVQHIYDSKIFEECLNYNLKNKDIDKVIIISDFYINFKHNKLIYKIDKNVDKIDVLYYVNKLFINKNIIISHPYIKIKEDLSKLDKNIRYVNDYLEIFPSLEKSSINYNFNIEILINNYTKNNVIINKHISKDSLTTIIVSYNLHNLLKEILKFNIDKLDNLYVITDHSDDKTQKICISYAVNCLKFDILTDNLLDKSKAINLAIEKINPKSYILLLDSDIVLKEKINLGKLRKNILYSAKRIICETIDDISTSKLPLNEPIGLGYYQLFHSSRFTPYEELGGGRFSENKWQDRLFSSKFDKIMLLDDVFHLGIPGLSWSVLKKSRRENINPKLAVITTFFNPKNYINMRYNYLKFAKEIKKKADLFTIELSYDGNFFIKNDENVIRIYGNEKNKVWQKERLLNILLEKIPSEYTNIAWVDCDVIFENDNWVDELNSKLNEYKVVQLYEKAKRLGSDGNIEIISNGIVSKINELNKLGDLKIGITGFAWGIRREVIDKINFLDTQIIGGADALMLYSFIGLNNDNLSKTMNEEWYNEYKKWYDISFDEVNLSVGNIKGDIIHLYHGKRENRNYNNRYNLLTENNFDPKHDLTKDINGLWKLNNTKILQNMDQYFSDRNEDDNIITVNSTFDHVYILSLVKEKDRRYNIHNKMKHFGIDYTFFDAIDGNLYNDNDYDFSNFVIGKGMIENKYALACLKSHIEIIKDAKKNNYNKILVFEDDVLFDVNFNILFQDFKKIKDWKLVYLGATQYTWDVEFIENFYYARYTLGTFSYCIDSSIYDEIIALNEEKISIDNLLKLVHNKYYGKCYVFYPNICLSDVSSSNIRESRNQVEHNIKMKWNLIDSYI